MSQRRICSRILIMTALVLILSLSYGSSPAQADPPLYLVDTPFSDVHSWIYQVDPTTGALQVRADLGTTYSPVLGMAAASSTVLYLTGTDTGASQACQGDISCLLLRVELDPLSTLPVLVQVVGTVTEGGAMLAGITGLTFRQDGNLYAISQNTNGLYIIDTNTAVATRIGTVDLELHGGDLTFDGTDRLWIWSNIGPGAGLYELDPVTAQASAFDIVPNLNMAGLSAVGHGDNMQAGSTSDSHLYGISPVLGLTGSSIQLSLGGAPFSYKRGDMDSPFCEGDEVCDDGDPCTADVCTPGGCQHPPATDGILCDDGDACTQADSCQAGVCVGANPVTCTAQDACHVAGTCDPVTGACSEPEAADGTACDDGDACTQADSCQAGMCVGSSPVVCAAPDPCHEAGVCDPTTGACGAPASKPDGTACDDGDACTQADSCQAGVCVGSNPVTCTAQDACHVAGTCDPSTGTCSSPAAADGTACDDGDACTQADSCQAGVCVGSSPVTCTAQDACHVAGTCDPATGTCSNPVAADGTPCDDGNACTQNESCLAGSCQGGTPTDLDGDSHVALICGGDDCSDTDPLVWAAPAEVAHLTIRASDSSSSLSWDSQDFLAGPETVYDLVSGSFTGDAGLSFLSSTSLQNGGGNAYTDSRTDPSSGEGFWYLARGKNSCGTGSFGTFQRDSSLSPSP